jgi:preprotein translocase subunit SecG
MKPDHAGARIPGQTARQAVGKEGAMIPMKKILGILAFYFAFCLLVS